MPARVVLGVAGGIAGTLSKQGQFALPIKLGPAEATALVITPQ